MKTDTDLKAFIPNEEVSSVEVASINFDQWILTIAIRLYGKKPEQPVIGMTHVVFYNPRGFRLLDEGDMLQFPWDRVSKSKSFVHRVDEGGWLDLEKNAGNLIHAESHNEYLIITGNECVSVITGENDEPHCISAC